MKLLYIIIFTPFLCFSQDKKDTLMLEKKVTEVKISAVKSNKPLDALPIPTTLITEKEITQSSASKLDEVLEFVKSPLVAELGKYS